VAIAINGWFLFQVRVPVSATRLLGSRPSVTAAEFGSGAIWDAIRNAPYRLDAPFDDPSDLAAAKLGSSSPLAIAGR
jgi:hypothetical protein